MQAINGRVVAVPNFSKSTGSSSAARNARESVPAAQLRIQSLPDRHAGKLSKVHRLQSSKVAEFTSRTLQQSRGVTRAQAAEVAGKPTILVAEKLGEAGLDLLRKVANVDCSYNLTPEELAAKIPLCDALIVRSGTKVTREVFEAANGRLKVVGRAGVGIDNVDLQAATEVGCLVVNAPTANTVAAAEHGIALLCAMSRNVAQASASLKAGRASISQL